MKSKSGVQNDNFNLILKFTILKEMLMQSW